MEKERFAAEVLKREIGEQQLWELVHASAMDTKAEPWERQIDLSLGLEAEWDAMVARIVRRRGLPALKRNELTQPNFHRLAVYLLETHEARQQTGVAALTAAMTTWLSR